MPKTNFAVTQGYLQLKKKESTFHLALPCSSAVK